MDGLALEVVPLEVVHRDLTLRQFLISLGSWRSTGRSRSLFFLFRRSPPQSVVCSRGYAYLKPIYSVDRSLSTMRN